MFFAAAGPGHAVGFAAAWGKPPDSPAWAALAVAGALLLIAFSPEGPRWLANLVEFASIDDLSRRRRFLTVASLAAAFLSLGYIHQYLRDGPRAVEAATYFVQGRALSHGHFAWSVPEPTESFRGRMFSFTGPDQLSGVLPPGFPLLLAAAFQVGAPMLVGPLLAGALVLATYFLTIELAREGSDPRAAEATARFSVGVSMVCVALRYHTADTLAHGAAALGVTLALACGLRARRTGQPTAFFLAGLALGYVVATRPVSAVPVGAVVLALASRAPARRPAFGALLGATLPGVLLLLASQKAATGSAWIPPAILRDVATASHAGKLALVAVLGGAAKALAVHLGDIANAEPLALFVLVPLLQARRGGSRTALFALLVVAGEILVNVPCGADGVAPGAGDGLLADILPVEHALVALAIAGLWPGVAIGRKALAFLALACAGFAVHAVNGHIALAKEGNGRPAYDPDVAREGNVQHGLLYFESEEGFDLAYEPDVTPSHGLLAARFRGDDHDRLLYDRLGHPATHKYLDLAGAPAQAAFWVPPAPSTSAAYGEEWRFESESDWPPLAQKDGRAAAVTVSTPCASEGAVLTVTPTGSRPARVEIDLQSPRSTRWTIVPRVFQRGGPGKGKLTVLGGDVVQEWTFTDEPAAGQPPNQEYCLELPGKPLVFPPIPGTPQANTEDDAPRATLVIEAEGGPVSVDRVVLRQK
jgi:hypothetical protein